MMVQKIKSHEILSNFVEDTCCENGICVTIDSDVTTDSYVIIKVDKYYNSLNLEKTPASIDCLIIRECVGGGYGLTLVELKNISSSKGFDYKNMVEKFETTLDKFISLRFKNILDIPYDNIRLYFVSNQDIHKRDLCMKMDMLINVRFKFQGKNVMITPIMPNPTIKKCYKR